MISKALNALLQRANPEAVETLQRRVGELEKELEAANHRFAIAAGAQAALQKHSAALKADHPDLWARFFTKAGRAVREAEKSMVTPC